jgi:hypothetical protein
MESNKNIDKYYSNIDKSILNNLCTNEKLKNLIYLSMDSDVFIFNKKQKLKCKDKLLKECEIIKKKEIKLTSNLLSNLAKLNNNSMHVDNLKNIYKNLESKIINIDNLINHLDNINLDSNIKNDNIIEYYSN